MHSAPHNAEFLSKTRPSWVAPNQGYHLLVLCYYKIDLTKGVKGAGQQDEKYHQLKKKLLQNGEDEEYHLSEDGLVRF